MNIPHSHKVVCLDKEKELLVTYGLSSDVGDNVRECGVYFWSTSGSDGAEDVPDYVWLSDHENIQTIILEPFEEKLLCFFEVTSDLSSEFPVNGEYTALSQNAAQAFAKFFKLKIEIKSHSDWTSLSPRNENNQSITSVKCFPDHVTRFLEAESKGNAGSTLLLLFAFIPISGFIGLVLGVLGFRVWARRRVFSHISHKKSLDHYASRVYAPALWSFFWRSGLCTLLYISVCLLMRDTFAATLAGLMLAKWSIALVFVIDVPLWVLRSVRKKLSTSSDNNVANQNNHEKRALR
jgi:hypothetical protein